MTSFSKHGRGAFAKQGSATAVDAEAAGLAELAQAARAGGAPVVRLLDRGQTWLHTARLSPAPASRAAAEEFARRLALTHAHCPEGRRVFGQAPSGLAGDGVMGAARLPLVPAGSASRSFGEFYAADRLLPYLDQAVANGSVREPAVIERLADRLRDGIFDAPQPRLVTAEAALLHGDLWSGNVMWVSAGSAAEAAVGVGTDDDAAWSDDDAARKNGGADDSASAVGLASGLAIAVGPASPADSAGATAGTGAVAEANAALDPANIREAGGSVAVLIDPACQGGHAESDLAQLTVFGAPHVERIYAAYDEASPLAEGWRERVGLHRLHILIVHAALFGGSYGRQTLDEARAYL